MTVYRCRVADTAGKITELMRDAASEESAARELMAEGWYPVSIAVQSAERSVRRERYPRQIIIEFTDTLAVMIDSGLSVRDALEVSQAVFNEGKTKKLTDAVVSKLEKGNTFSSVTEDLRTSFPPVYRGLVRIGERVGSLEGILKELAAYLNDDKKLKDKIFGSLLYPILVLCVAAIGIVTIIVVVFPKIKAILESLSQSSPAQIDRMLHSVTAALGAGGGIIGLLTAAVGIALTLRRTGGDLARRVDAILLRVPLAGRAILNSELFLFSFAMEMLTANGVTAEDALAESAGVLSNHSLRDGVTRVKAKIETGDRLSAAFAAEPHFPKRISRWIAIGERVGSVDRVFGQLKSYYQSELEKWTTRFMSLIEPGLIVLVGVAMMYMVFTFIIPIFNLFGNLL